MIRVNTIYAAFQGESNIMGIGARCTFLRLAGCNLRCYAKTKGSLCDTPEALTYTSGKPMEIPEIMNTLEKLGSKLVCLTGGEPLSWRPIELLEEMSRKGYIVSVETNGSIDISPYRHIENVHFVVDYKTASTGESGSFNDLNTARMDKDDFLKFVIDTEEDYEEMRRTTYKFVTNPKDFPFNVSVGLFWGSKIGYQELMQKLIKDELPFYLNMQTHKMAVLYDSTKDEIAGKLLIPREL